MGYGFCVPSQQKTELPMGTPISHPWLLGSRMFRDLVTKEQVLESMNKKIKSDSRLTETATKNDQQDMTPTWIWMNGQRDTMFWSRPCELEEKDDYIINVHFRQPV